MNPQSANQKDPQTTIELRIRTLRTLWIALLASVGMYYVFTILVGRPADITPNQSLSLILIGIAILTTLISFPIKNRFFNRAVEQREVLVVQRAYVVAWALTEVGALLGLMDFYMTGNRYYYIPMIIAACGVLLHFPRHEPVINAAFKSSTL